MYTLVNVLVFMLGNDDGRFLMDKETGEMKLIHSIRDRLETPVLHLKVMVRLPLLERVVDVLDIVAKALPFKL